ncbi:UNVERIFIED_CONTAM: hypothetical protein FKN15_019012 [Acipenser sinensis]
MLKGVPRDADHSLDKTCWKVSRGMLITALTGHAGRCLGCTKSPGRLVKTYLFMVFSWVSILLSETTELGSRKEMRSMPFITYLSGLLSAQLLSDEQLISGVEIRCEEKGRCPATCHLCRRQGKEQVSPSPVLLEITRVLPLYTLIQDNATKEAFRNAVMSTYWCTGKGDVIEDWCRCDLSAFDENGLPNCSPLLQPELRLAPNLEPSSTMVAMEWLDIEPVIGCKISDFIIQHKKVEDPLEAEIYTGVQLQMLIYC